MFLWMPVLSLGCSSPVEPVVAPLAARPCGDCHAEQVAAHAGSQHARAEREVTSADAWARDAVRIIGVYPLEQALVEAEGGRLQVLDPARDVRTGERFSIFDDERRPGEWGHWTGAGMTWNARCAACHDTGVDKGLQPDGTYRTTVEAVGVTCAACHGDARDHAAGGPPPVNARMEDTCLSCHTRRTELTGVFRPGDAFLDHFLPLTLAHPDFRSDGRARGEVFVGNAFLASGMHDAGVTCASCHDPHSGAVLRDGDALCTGCHVGPAMEAHPAHPGAAVACVDCHMPITTVMARDDRRDHAFTTPRAGLSPDPCTGCHADHPAKATPDPQHTAFERVRSGGPLDDLDLAPANAGRHAAVLTLLGDRPVGADVLRDRLTHPDPWVRTAAASAFVPQVPADLGRLEATASDPVRAVRVGAQRSLARAGQPLATLPDLATYQDHNADEPAVLAERGLTRIQQGEAAGIADLRRAVALDPGTPRWAVALATGWSTLGDLEAATRVLQAHPEDPDVLVALGLTLARRGRLDDAVRALTRAADAPVPPPRVWRNLAIVQETRGDREAALSALDRALAAAPDDQELVSWRARLAR
jgi:predicted CXXCH cytochrome family protein